MSPNAPPSIVNPVRPQGLAPGDPPPPSVRVRQVVEQSNTAALAQAYATMQGRSAADNRSWIYWAEFHGFNRFDCWHHGSQGGQSYPYDLFLPWHRAYLLYYEQVVLAADPAAEALPWWDWTSALSHQHGIPAAFQKEAALASGPIAPDFGQDPPQTSRDPGPPNQLPSAQTITSILGLSTFEDFSSQLQNQHDAVHGWVSGNMGVVAGSAFDPIFYSHHCMIDRIWYLWQVKHGVDNIPPGYLSEVLAPWKLTVRDVLSVEALGYTYGASRILVPAQNFTTKAI